MYAKLDILVKVTTVKGQNIKFYTFNSCKIVHSIDKVESSCLLKIPTSAALVLKDKVTESAQTATTFSRGDKFVINAGYNGDLKQEFEGFIYKINLTTPLEIELMGYEYLLLDKIETKTFKKTNLRQLLKYIINGKNIKLDGDIPEVQMVNYVIPANLRGIDALKQIKERYGLTIYFNKNVLYAGLDFTRQLGDINYSLGVNTVRAGELKFQYADDVKLKIKAIQINKNNTRFEAEVGDKSGEARTLYFYTAKSVADLKKLAEVEILKYKYTGYTGKLTTWLQPWSQSGMIANIKDIKYPVRAGKYEIRGVETTIGTGGARRVLDIGKTVS